VGYGRSLQAVSKVVTDALSFQEVQGKSALGASLRILPSLIVGALLNLSTGIFVNRMPVLWMVLICSGLCAIAPLLMAVIRPEWRYWYDAFIAQVCSYITPPAVSTLHLGTTSTLSPHDPSAFPPSTCG